MMELTTSNSVLVLVDWQERLSSAMHADLHERNLGKACTLAASAVAADIPVLITEQYPRGLGPTLGALRELLPSVAPIEKRDFDCSSVQDFREAIEALGRTHVVLAGMEAHICIFQTARGLLSRGYVVHIPRDAVLSRNRADFLAALALYERCGAVTTSSETVVFDWVKRGEGPLFKTVSKLVR